MNLQFAGDTFAPLEFLKLKKEFNIEVIVETGTNAGHTTNWFSKNFDEIYTIEINPASLSIAKEYCKDFDNITYFLGSTSEILNEIIPKISDKNTIFFLDAHGSNPCPTISELIHIKNMKVSPVICIHDFYVPGKNFAWDTYPDFDYKWENIEKYINDIYGLNNYTYYYNSEANGCNVGLIYITPNKI